MSQAEVNMGVQTLPRPGWLQWLFLPLLLVVLFGLFNPEPLQLPPILPQIDKYGHFGAFLSLTWISLLLVPQGRSRWWALLPILILGLGSEVVQGALLPHRGGYSLGDMAANMGGIISAWLASRLGLYLL